MAALTTRSDPLPQLPSAAGSAQRERALVEGAADLLRIDSGEMLAMQDLPLPAVRTPTTTTATAALS